jgi:hypothetical protein
MSRDTVHARIAKYQKSAARTCPSLVDKNLTPHTLRHSTAMHLRHAGVDNAVIALWLGHHDIRSTQVYTHADLKLKEQALDRTIAPRHPASHLTASNPPTNSSPSSKPYSVLRHYPDRNVVRTPLPSGSGRRSR